MNYVYICACVVMLAWVFLADASQSLLVDYLCNVFARLLPLISDAGPRCEVLAIWKANMRKSRSM